MARDCIICGGRAGSREHIFPAGLGGRRTNKGIYCGTHNEGFSPLAVLIGQLRAINAPLSVRPDHGTRASAVRVDGPDGQPLELSGTKVKVVPPSGVMPLTDGNIGEVAFASEVEALEWVRRQRAAGHDIKLTTKE